MNAIETNFEDVIRWLQAASHLSPDQSVRLLDEQKVAVNPQVERNVDRAWYIKLFIGLSAWIAATFLISGISSLAFVASGPMLALIGTVIIFAALGLKWLRRQSTFWGQFAFALSLTGQSLLFGGIIRIVTRDFESLEPNAVTLTALVILIVEIGLFFIYPDTIHRLFSVIFGSLAAMVLVAEQFVSILEPDPAAMDRLASLLPFFLLFFSLCIFLIWKSRTRILAGRWHSLHAPLGYGFAIVALGLSLSSALVETPRWWMASIGLALLLAHLGTQVVDEFADKFDQPLLAKLGVIAAIGLLLIPLYGTPGIWVALLTLLLGFQQGSRLLTGLAGLFLLFFIGFYYYSLEITLINKSYALMGSGVMLLLIRFVGGRLLGRTTHGGQKLNTPSNGEGVSI